MSIADRSHTISRRYALHIAVASFVAAGFLGDGPSISADITMLYECIRYMSAMLAWRRLPLPVVGIDRAGYLIQHWVHTSARSSEHVVGSCRARMLTSSLGGRARSYRGFKSARFMAALMSTMSLRAHVPHLHPQDFKFTSLVAQGLVAKCWTCFTDAGVKLII